MTAVKKTAPIPAYLVCSPSSSLGFHYHSWTEDEKNCFNMIDFFLIDCCKFSAKNQQCYKLLWLFSLEVLKRASPMGTAFLWIIINLYSVPCHSLQNLQIFKFGKLILNFWANSTAFGLYRVASPHVLLGFKISSEQDRFMYSKSKTARYLYSCLVLRLMRQ
jgi:hypothetical protein